MTVTALIRNLFGEAAPLATAEMFEEFYQQTQMAVFRYICGLHGGPAAEAEDLTAETFLRAWRSRHRFSGDANAALGWVLTIARRLVIDSHRRRARRQHESFEPDLALVDEVSPADHMLRREQARTLWLLLQRLPSDDRELLILRYMLDWRVNRIAQHVGMAENTVSVRIRRTLQRLRREWPQLALEDE